MSTEPAASREAVEEAAATWIARRGGERWTASDDTALNAWLAESAGHRVAYYRLSAVWDQAAHLEKKPSASRVRWLAAAAVAVLLVAGTVVSLQGGRFAPPMDPAPRWQSATKDAARKIPQTGVRRPPHRRP